jgi:hypothetical protein
MKKSLIAFFLIAALMAVSLKVLFAGAGQRPGPCFGPGHGRHTPPKEAIESCKGKKADDVCQASFPNGWSLSGICLGPTDAPLACMPKDGPHKRHSILGRLFHPFSRKHKFGPPNGPRNASPPPLPDCPCKNMQAAPGGPGSMAGTCPPPPSFQGAMPDERAPGGGPGPCMLPPPDARSGRMMPPPGAPMPGGPQAMPQQNGPGAMDPRPNGPPPEAVAACEKSKEGQTCEFKCPMKGDTVQGVCRAARNGSLACAPKDAPHMGGH